MGLPERHVYYQRFGPFKSPKNERTLPFHIEFKSIRLVKCVKHSHRVRVASKMEAEPSQRVRNANIERSTLKLLKISHV